MSLTISMRTIFYLEFEATVYYLVISVLLLHSTYHMMQLWTWLMTFEYQNFSLIFSMY